MPVERSRERRVQSYEDVNNCASGIWQMTRERVNAI